MYKETGVVEMKSAKAEGKATAAWLGLSVGAAVRAAVQMSCSQTHDGIMLH